MSKTPVIVVDVLRDVVAKVAIEAATKGICASVRFFHGPVEELENDLVAITKAIGVPGYTGVDKYPCIYVLQDFPEDFEGTGGYYNDTTLPLVAIMALSSMNYSSDERYNVTLRPVLYPLYDLFKKYLARDGRIVGQDPDAFKHRKYDRLFYGRKKFGTAVTDYVDAIELNNLKLTMLQFQNC